jgi:hypothetical protein
MLGEGPAGGKPRTDQVGDLSKIGRGSVLLRAQGGAATWVPAPPESSGRRQQWTEGDPAFAESLSLHPRGAHASTRCKSRTHPYLTHHIPLYLSTSPTPLKNSSPQAASAFPRFARDFPSSPAPTVSLSDRPERAKRSWLMPSLRHSVSPASTFRSLSGFSLAHPPVVLPGRGAQYSTSCGSAATAPVL